MTPAERQAVLADYAALVAEYHATLDLVSPAAHRAWPELVRDSEAFVPVVEEFDPGGGAIVDVGSGVGLPGVPLALAWPDRDVHVVERRRRRAAFLNLAKGRLGLLNVTVHGADVQDLQGIVAGVVTAQGVGSFVQLYALTRHLHGDTVLLVNRKGSGWEREVGELSGAIGSEPLATGVRTLEGGGGVVAGVVVPGGLACR